MYDNWRDVYNTISEAMTSSGLTIATFAPLLKEHQRPAIYEGVSECSGKMITLNGVRQTGRERDVLQGDIMMFLTHGVGNP